MSGCWRGLRRRSGAARTSTVDGVVRLHQDLAKVVVQKSLIPGREVEGVVNWYVGVLGAMQAG